MPLPSDIPRSVHPKHVWYNVSLLVNEATIHLADTLLIDRGAQNSVKKDRKIKRHGIKFMSSSRRKSNIII
jgi:hypothetical protein